MTADVAAEPLQPPSLTHLQGSIVILLTGIGFCFGGLRLGGLRFGFAIGGVADRRLLPYGFIAAIIPIGFGLYDTLIRSTAQVDAMVPLAAFNVG